MIQSVPCEINQDHTTILTLAQEKNWVTVSILLKELSWNKERINNVLVNIYLFIKKKINNKGFIN